MKSTYSAAARGTRRPDSDADVASGLRGAKGDRGIILIDLAGVAFDVMIKATPLWEAEFDDAECGLTRYLVRDIRHDGIRL